MFAILVILCLHVIQSQSFDICEHIQRDGVYTGVHIYKNRFFIDAKNTIKYDYHMWANGKEWPILVNASSEDVTIDDNTQYTNYTPGLINQYKNFDLYSIYKCVVHRPEEVIRIDCKVDGKGYAYHDMSASVDVPEFDQRSIIFFGYGHHLIWNPIDNQILNLTITFDINKTTRKGVFGIDVKNSTKKLDKILQFLQMKESLRRQLENIVDVRITDELNSGHLLWFNINGRPKYCYTPLRELSKQCSSSEELIAFQSECFNSKAYGKEIYLWVIFGFLIVFFFLLNILIIVWCIQPKNDTKNHLMSTKTPNDSQNSTFTGTTR